MLLERVRNEIGRAVGCFEQGMGGQTGFLG
jgi:hypothetical protein